MCQGIAGSCNHIQLKRISYDVSESIMATIVYPTDS